MMTSHKKKLQFELLQAFTAILEMGQRQPLKRAITINALLNLFFPYWSLSSFYSSLRVNFGYKHAKIKKH